MAQKKPAAKKAATKKPSAKRARNKDGTYKGDDKSTPDVNEAYESPKPGTKATTKPRNPAAKQREASKKPAAKKAVAKKPAAKKHTYAPKVKKPAGPVKEMLDATQPATFSGKPTVEPYKPTVEEMWRSTPTATKKSRVKKMWSWLVGE
jgi:histone H1/5